MKPNNWIAEATKNRGGLHRSLGIKQGVKIPVNILKSKAKSKGRVGKQARLALTLRSFRKARKSGKMR